jgi:hypothetical protein
VEEDQSGGSGPERGGGGRSGVKDVERVGVGSPHCCDSLLRHTFATHCCESIAHSSPSHE